MTRPDTTEHSSAPQPPKPLHEIMHPTWAQALSPVEDSIRTIGERLRAEVSAGQGYLPAGPNIFRAFAEPFPAVRVLIVGQDPYPTPGHAMGLSFSVAPDVRPLPKSLKNIFTELCSDLDVPMPSSGDLTPWSNSGVMLLNRVLTVAPGSAGSHRGRGWEEVTDCAVAALVAARQPLVAILWGKDAQKLKPQLGTVPTIESVHPSPLSAHRGFFGSRPFSRANQLLIDQGAKPVTWRLP